MSSGIITKGVGGAYTVETDDGPIVCTARGIFRNRQVTPLVGDRVEITVTDRAEKIGTLHTIAPRVNELRRPRVANVDQAIVTMAAESPAFDAGLLDRFLLLAESAGVSAIICMNKCDLRPDTDALLSPYTLAGYTAVFVSALRDTGLDGLRQAMAGKTSVFAGPSGAGKSSLINRVTRDGLREVGELSAKINRGKHTTRHTELLPLADGGFCVDTPGFTSLDISGLLPAQYAALFREFTPFLGQCRFSDCRHDSEADCAVKAQVGLAIHPRRYACYLSLLRPEKA